MGIYLTNIAAMRSMLSLNNVTSQLDTTFQRLSTGLRINSAKDDPAGLQISNRMTAEINGLNQASRNASDGIAFLQTAEAGMDEMTNLLQRMRTLAVQAASDTNTQDDRDAIQNEIDQLSAEITRLSKQTTYGGKNILGGKGAANSMYDTNGKLVLQVGAYSGNTIEIDMSEGFSLNDLISATNNVATNIIAIAGYDGSRNDNEGAFNVSTRDDASAAIGLIDKVLGEVDGRRGVIGAMQTRLESVIRMNNNTQTNLADARSRIRDTDYAEESANLFQQQIRQQASLMMLMQAQSSKGNLILSLLQGI